MNGQSRAGRAGAGEWILNTLKQNPEGLLLLAAGAVLMMRKSASASRPRASMASADSANMSSSSVSGAASSVQDAASEITDRAFEKVASYASSASDYAGQARRAIGEQSVRAVRQTQSTLQETITRIVQDQPLAVALAGLAAGAAIAAAFPATDIERQTLGPIGEQASEAAERVGEQLKQATAKAGQTLKTAADERGLNPEGLKEVATEVASAFSSSMSGQSQRGTGSESANRPGAGREFK